jgi:hypothetical protein
LPIDFFELDINSSFEQVPRNDNPNKSTKLYKTSFSKEDSPLIFRNFLTFSLKEDFKSAEFYVDNEFHVDEILEMDQRHFERYKVDESKNGKWYVRNENGDPVRVSNFHKQSSFYLRIPDEVSIKYRK